MSIVGVATSRGLVLVMAAALTMAAAESCGAPEPSGPVTLPADYAAVIGPASLDGFRELAAIRFTPLSPAQARLVGPTYGVALDACATAAVLHGTAYHHIVGIDPDDQSAHHRRDVAAGPGRQFVLAHIPAEGHLPEPELGYGNGPLFWDWTLTVAGRPCTLTSHSARPSTATPSGSTCAQACITDEVPGALVPRPHRRAF